MLVEKPMARSLAEADEMIAAAAAAGAALAVGHTERFNPAVEAARPLLVDPRFIEVHRLGTFPERSLDIDVVFDLMIHDLDVVLSLVTVRGRVDRGGRRAGADRPRRHRERAAAVRQRLHRQSHRQPHQPRSGPQDPLLSAGRRICRSTTRRRRSRCWRLVKGAGPMPSIEGGEVPVVNEEPLKRELTDFVEAVASKRAPLVDGQQGRRALQLATRIVEKMASV